MTRFTARIRRSHDSEPAARFRSQPVSMTVKAAITSAATAVAAVPVSGGAEESTASNTIVAKRSKRNTRTVMCFQCRQPGHALSQCPQSASNAAATARSTTKILCYACGSASHSLRDCLEPAEVKRALKFAMCFYCHAHGHLASQCPDNERGLYPHGGGCRFCGSVRHFAKDCKPTRQEEGVIQLGLVRDTKDSADADDVQLAFHRMDHDPVRAKVSARKRAVSSNASAIKVIDFK